jgi:putative pyruvate formate lyase activating enzyme
MTACELRSIHNRPLLHLKRSKTGPSVLDLKVELADRMLGKCVLCERRCGADRAAGETGFCGVASEARFFFEQTLWGEEQPLVPSHEVFLSGCNMRCRYCYSWEYVAEPDRGSPVSPEELARLIDRRHREGALNVNLIGGEPTVHLPSILRALRLTETRTAVVWNSNFFMSGEAMSLLNGVVDLYVGDFRFGNDLCASEVAGTDGYFATASRNFEVAASSGELIIRHLLLPGHVDCCLHPIAEWVAAKLPGVPFNLMFQYTPCFGAVADPVLGVTVSDAERGQALKIVRSLGLNTRRWNRPIRGRARPNEVGSGEFGTGITVRPDGRVIVQHLHADLIDLVQALGQGGQTSADAS